MTELPFVPVPGIRLGTAAAGIKRPDRDDVLLMEVAPGHRAACWVDISDVKVHVIESEGVAA